MIFLPLPPVLGWPSSSPFQVLPVSVVSWVFLTSFCFSFPNGRFLLTWPSPWVTPVLRKDPKLHQTCSDFFGSRSQARVPGQVFGRPPFNPLHRAGPGLDPRIFVRPPRWATPGQGRRRENRHLSQRRKNPKHTAVTASCEHRPFSHNLGLTYLRGLLSPEDQSLREKPVSPVPLCPWAADLTPLVLSIKHCKVTRRCVHLVGVGKSPKC